MVQKIVLLFVLALVGVGLLFSLRGKTIEQQKASVPSATIAPNKPVINLSGKVIYQKTSGDIFEYFVGTGQEFKIMNKAYILDYRNGYLFVNSQDSGDMIRLSLVNQNQIGLPYKPLDITQTYASPDGSKLIILTSQVMGPENRSYLYDFEKKTISPITTNQIFVNPQWFSNSLYFLFGVNEGTENKPKTVIEIVRSTDMAVKIIDDAATPIAVSKNGLAMLWVKTFEDPTDKSILFRKTIANLIYRSLAYYFPEVKDPTRVVANEVIPFSKFPVVARDFRTVNKIIPGNQESDFFLEIDSGKTDIYFTDSWSTGTFKKLTPNTTSVYRLLGYSPESQQILALRAQPPAKKPWTVITLDPGNYAETVAAIDQKNFRETHLADLGNNSYYPDDFSGYSFSPDGRYVLLPRASFKPSDFRILALDGSFQLNINPEFGQRFFWIE
jgi:hypothetical protein